MVVVVQSLSGVQLFATPWTEACQATPSFTISWSLLKLTSIELVMPSNHLIMAQVPLHRAKDDWLQYAIGCLSRRLNVVGNSLGN